MTTSMPFRDLLNDANLRHGTDGSNSPPKKGVQRIFFALKNPTASGVTCANIIKQLLPVPVPEILEITDLKSS